MYQPPTSEFGKMTKDVVSLIHTLPASMRDENREALYDIIEELRGSYEAELPWLRQVKRLSVDHPTRVTELRDALEAYDDQRLWEWTRTHCHHVRDVVHAMLAPYRRTGDRAFIDDVEAALNPIMYRDDEFVSEIEAAMRDARAALTSIDAHLQAGEADLARAEHERFVAAYDERIGMLKSTLGELTTVITSDLGRRF